MTLYYYLDAFIHIFYVLCVFVLVNSFCKKKKFKTDLITSFILLLLSTSKLNTVFILCPPNKRSKIKNFLLSILSDSILFKPFPSNQLKTILTSHTIWIFGLGGLRLNKPFQHCDIRG